MILRSCSKLAHDLDEVAPQFHWPCQVVQALAKEENKNRVTRYLTGQSSEESPLSPMRRKLVVDFDWRWHIIARVLEIEISGRSGDILSIGS